MLQPSLPAFQICMPYEILYELWQIYFAFTSATYEQIFIFWGYMQPGKNFPGENQLRKGVFPEKCHQEQRSDT